MPSESVTFGNIPVVADPRMPQGIVLMASQSQIDAYNKLLNADLFSKED